MVGIIGESLKRKSCRRHTWGRLPTDTRSGLVQLWTYTDIVDASGNSQWACSGLISCGYRRREWQLALGLLSFKPMRRSSTRVATRSGLARFWIHAEIDDVSGNSQWACSPLDCYGYHRRGWQLAVALLSVWSHADADDVSRN